MAGRNRNTPTKQQLLERSVAERARRKYIDKKTAETFGMAVGAMGEKKGSKYHKKMSSAAKTASEERRHAGGTGRVIGGYGKSPKPRKRSK